MSNNPIINDTLKKLNKIYLKAGYMTKHGTDVWVSVIICIVFIIAIYYYYYSNVLEVIRADWPNQKCNPLVIPFAGFINKPKNKTNLQFTSENFTMCVGSVLEYITNIAVNPFRVVLNIINKTVQSLVKSFNMLREMLDELRKNTANISESINSKLYNLMAEIIKLLINTKDVFSKTAGALVTSVYVLYGSFMAMESLFLSILDLLILILIAIGAICVVFICIAIYCYRIPIIGYGLMLPPAWMALMWASIMLVITIPVIIMVIFMMRVLKLSSPPLPGIPRCFSKDTIISLFNDEEKHIGDIKLGDKLKNGGIVTATFTCDAKTQNMYKLKGIHVTGEHRVFHPTMKWIKVKEHPESILMPSFNDEYVYCLNTTNKEFVINDIIFSDWDDIDDKLVNDLNENCVKNGYLPKDFTYDNIHTYLDSGFAPSTLVRLNNGSEIKISDVKVNDILENNTTVLGVIKIDGSDIKQYKHIFGEKNIVGTKNIHINDTNLGIIHGMKEKHNFIQEKTCSPVLYHLLTDRKFYSVNDIKVHDYNYGIDVYIS